MGPLKFLAATRLTIAAVRQAKPLARRLSFIAMMLFASVCIIIGAIASLFVALYELLDRYVGSGWSSIATSLVLWLLGWLMWELAWRLPLRQRPQTRHPARRAARRSAARSRH